MRWTADAAIAALREWADEHDRQPTYNAFRVAPPGCPARTTLVKLFGSWSAALEAAGFQPRGPGEYERVCRLPERVCGVCGEPFRKPRRLTLHRLFGSWSARAPPPTRAPRRRGERV